jgi:hypothetical protein
MSTSITKTKLLVMLHVEKNFSDECIYSKSLNSAQIIKWRYTTIIRRS